MIDLNEFSPPREFSFDKLSEYKFGGVYIIYSVDKNKNMHIVKIGESNFIFRRIANFLTPSNKKEKLNKKRVTKNTIQETIQKGKKKELNYKIVWKIENDKKKRLNLEKELIIKFKSNNNGNRPIMNKIDR